MFSRNRPDRDDPKRPSLLDGRIGRRDYWLCLATLITVNLALTAAHIRLLSFAPMLLAVLLTRRFHDFGRSAVWAVAYVFALLFLQLAPGVLLQLLLGLALFGLLILFGAVPGDAGPNRFGPPATPLSWRRA